MLKQKTFLALLLISVVTGCSYFNPPDLNMLIEQSRGEISFTSLQISPTAMTTNSAQEVTISCSVSSDFPVNTVTADLSSVGQGLVKLNPSADKKSFSIKIIVTPQAIGTYSFDISAVNQKEKTVKGSVSLAMTLLSLSAVYVSPSGDDNNPGNQAFPFKTLGHAVTYATAAGITNIYLANGSYVEENAAYSCAVALVGITNDLRIQGGWNSDFSVRSVATYPSVIDGNRAQPSVMVIQNTTNLVLDGVSLKNAKPDPALTNFISFRGGGLYASQSVFSYINGEISGNESVYGGGIYATDVSGIISNSSISNNLAVNQYSGAVFFRSPVRVERCGISGNTGDGIQFIHCTNFVFQYNLVFTNAGDGCVLSNSASASPFYSNTIGFNGSYGIRFHRSDIASICSNVVMNNNTGMSFLSNLTTPVRDNSLLGNLSGFNINYSAFHLGNNTVFGGSSGLYLNRSVGMAVSNNIFNGSGASYSAPVYITMTSNLLFMNNTVVNGAVYGYYVDDYKASGGIMLMYCTNARLVNNTIVSNTYSGQNGYGAGGIGLYYSYALISNNVISWNNGKNGGGISTCASDITIDRNCIDSNISYWNGSSSLGGGGICITYYFTTANKIIRNNSISYNAISNWSSSYPCYGGSAVYLYAADVYIVSNIMIENATVGYSSNDAVIYIPNMASDTETLSNVIGANNQTAIGICNDNNRTGKIDANVFVTNKTGFLYRNSSKTITNDVTWTNINSTNYTGASSLTVTPNTVTNL